MESENSSIAVKNLVIDRDGAVPSSDTWGYPFMHVDNDGEDLAHLAVVQRVNGNICSGLYVYNEKTDGTQVRNHLAVVTARDGTPSYEIASPAAFRNALGINWTVNSLLSFGDYNTEGQTLTLSSPATNYHIILLRFGFDSNNKTGSNGVVYRIVFPFLELPAQVNVDYYQDASLRQGCVGFIDSTHIKIVTSLAGHTISLRQVYGIKLF